MVRMSLIIIANKDGYEIMEVRRRMQCTLYEIGTVIKFRAVNTKVMIRAKGK